MLQVPPRMTGMARIPGIIDATPTTTGKIGGDSAPPFRQAVAIQPATRYSFV
jgi:hypothetical protein